MVKWRGQFKEILNNSWTTCGHMVYNLWTTTHDLDFSQKIISDIKLPVISVSANSI